MLGLTGSRDGQKEVLNAFERFVAEYQKPGAALISEIGNGRLRLLKVWPDGRRAVDDVVRRQFPQHIADKIIGEVAAGAAA